MTPPVAAKLQVITCIDRMSIKYVQKLCNETRIIWDYARNRIVLPSENYSNKKYFPGGILLFDMDSLRVWSFDSVESAIVFLENRLKGYAQFFPKIKPLSFYSEKADEPESYHIYDKNNLAHLTTAYSSHLEVCYENRANKYGAS